MTFNDFAITLVRKSLRESDLIASVYTKTRGRLYLRFPGVKKHKSKLKAFAEPFVWSEMRIFHRQNASVGCATGGRVYGVFGKIRKSSHKTSLALHMCELMLKLTPLHQPNSEKYHLMLLALKNLNDFPPTDAFRQAFTIRLMKTAGFGITTPPVGISPTFWRKLYEENFHKLNIVTPKEKEYLQKTDYIIERFFVKYFDRPLNTLVRYQLV